MAVVFREDIALDEIKDLPLIEYQGKFEIVDDAAKFEVAMKEILSHKIAGFDTETRPSFKKGVQYQVALLQVFCGQVCYLIRLNKVGFPDALRQWFEDESITKIGLSLRDDIRELRKKRQITPQNLVDLQLIVGDYDIAAMSLKKISAIVLGSRLSKRQQLSNWENPTLNDKQQIYAATDAWVCLEIYKRLKS
jgi:ribonuclease D